MFIAHLPAGYLLTAALPPRTKQRSLWLTGLFFAIAPDLDLFWFYLVSDRSAPHHAYPTHWPLLWLALFGAAFCAATIARKAQALPHIATGLASVMLHLVLDSFAAPIHWLAPFSPATLHLVDVPAIHGWWVWNFILHWTFAVEIAICLAAIALFIRRRNKKNGTPHSMPGNTTP